MIDDETEVPLDELEADPDPESDALGDSAARTIVSD